MLASIFFLALQFTILEKLTVKELTVMHQASQMIDKMSDTQKGKNKRFSASNITSAVLIIFLAAMFLSPDFKGLVSQGLMKVGLFQPSVPDNPAQNALIGETVVGENDNQVLFEDKDGLVTQLASLKGQVVFINFWATWCPPCIAEMPSIQKLYTEFKGNDKVVFMMVDVDNKRQKSQKFMDKKGYDLPVYTPASKIPTSYMGGAIPTTIVFDKYGKMVFKHEGMGDFANKEFKTFIAQLIAE